MPRKMYDNCATQQTTKQSTDPLELLLDVNKYVNCNNICKPLAQRYPSSAQLVDVESSLWGIDKLASRCDSSKHPFCAKNGCLLTNDPRIAPHITPYACEWGHTGDNSVVTTNMKMPSHPGYTLPNPNICKDQTNGYYHNAVKSPNMTGPQHQVIPQHQVVPQHQTVPQHQSVIKPKADQLRYQNIQNRPY